MLHSGSSLPAQVCWQVDDALSRISVLLLVWAGRGGCHSLPGFSTYHSTAPF